MTNSLFDLQDEKNSLEINRYIKARKQFADKLAFGIALLIIANAIWGFIESINIFMLIILFFIILILGIIQIIKANVSFKPYKNIIKKQYTLSDLEYDKLTSDSHKMQGQFIISIIIGIFSCILALILPIYFIISPANSFYTITSLFAFSAIGIFLFISSSIKLAIYQKLLK